METTRRIEGRGTRRSPREGHEIADKWRKSGLRAAEFCQRYDVPLHVLRYWAATKPRRESPSAKEFFMVAANGTATMGDATESDSHRADSGPRDVAKAIVIVLPMRPGTTAFDAALASVLRQVMS